MRVKHFWDYVPIPAKVKLMLDRITLSRLTVVYIVFSVVHCILQVIFQVQAFEVNASAAQFLNSIITQGNESETGFAVFGQDLRMCDIVPQTVDASSCPIVWSPSMTGNHTNNAANGAAVQQYVSSSVLSGTSSSIQSTANLAVLSTTTVSSIGSPKTSSLTPSTQSVATSVDSSPTVIAASRPTLPISLLQPEDESADSDAPRKVAITQTRTVTVQIEPTESADVNNQRLTSAKRETYGMSEPDSDSDLVSVKVNGLYGKSTINLSKQCLIALNWPLAKVDNTKREDIAFVGFSVWVLGMSLVAVLNESPPHIVASFLTHMAATAWSAFQIVNTKQFREDFSRLTTHGACDINLLPTYWSDRAKAEIPILALNALALLISTYLSWKLMKSFGWQTFKRIGASLTISHAYRTVLIFSIAIQLSAFFVVAAVALWIDQIYHGEIARLTIASTRFKIATIAVLILIPPWLALGWMSVRREHKIRMLMFLVLSFGYLVGWSAMFISRTFRWTFVEWAFFRMMAVASVLLILLTLVLGIICRTKYGKGLSKCLNAQEPLPGDDFIPTAMSYNEKGDEEKIDFPSYGAPLPTYMATYPEVPPMVYNSAGRVMGPRFQAVAADSLEMTSKSGLVRHESGSSQHSISSLASGDSTGSSMSMKGRRWVIE